MSELGFFRTGHAPIVSGVGAGLDDVSDDEAKYTRGSRFFAGCCEYVRVQASGTLLEGNTLQQRDFLSPVLDADVDAAAAIGTDRLVGTGDFAAFDGDSGGLDGAIVYINVGAGAGQARYIRRVVDADTIEVTEPWTIALTTGSDYQVVRPWVVAAKAATQLPVSGISKAAATDGQFLWAQVDGLGLVLNDGSDDVIAVGDIVTQSATGAGLSQGPTAGTATAGDLNGKIGVGFSDTGAGDVLTPVELDLSGKM